MASLRSHSVSDRALATAIASSNAPNSGRGVRGGEQAGGAGDDDDGRGMANSSLKADASRS